MKKAEFEGYLFQDISTNRKPIMLVQDNAKVSLEKLIADSKIVPTIATKYASQYLKPDFIGEGSGGYGFSVTKDSAKKHLKKVKVTITVEEV